MSAHNLNGFSKFSFRNIKIRNDLSFNSNGDTNQWVAKEDPDNSNWVLLRDGVEQLALTPTGDLSINGSFMGVVSVNSIEDADNTTSITTEATAETIIFNTNNIERMIIEAGGNVGIGTTNPSQKLEVNGNILIQNTIGGQAELEVKGIGTNPDIFLTRDNQDTTFSKFRIKCQDTQNRITTNIDLRFDTDEIETNALTIQQSTAFIGIGITNPTNKLHLEEESGVDNKQLFISAGIAAGNDSGIHIQGNRNNNNTAVMAELLFSNFNSTEGNSKILGSIGIQTTDTKIGDMIFYSYIDGIDTSRKETMRIEKSGFIGINNMNPSGYLDIITEETNGNAQIEIQNTATGTNAHARINLHTNSNTDGDPIIDFGVDGSGQFRMGHDGSDGNKFKIDWQNFGNMNIFTAKLTGEIGFNETNPDTKLHITQVTGGDMIKLDNSFNFMSLGVNTSNVPEIVSEFGDIRFITDRDTNGTTAVLTLGSSSLNVIGTGSYTANLSTNSDLGVGSSAVSKVVSGTTIHVRGVANSGIRFTNDMIGNTTTDGLEIYETVLGDALFVNNENRGMFFYTNNTLRFQIDNTGDVGIGTTPSFQLHLSQNSAAKPTSTLWTTTSDMNLKEDIIDADLNICYNDIKQIKLRRFKWIDTFIEKHSVLDEHVLGFISQEVELINAKCVETKIIKEENKNDYGFELSEIKMLNKDQFLMSLFGCVQKLITDKEQLESDIEVLDTRVGTLENDNEELQILVGAHEQEIEDLTLLVTTLQTQMTDVLSRLTVLESV